MFELAVVPAAIAGVEVSAFAVAAEATADVDVPVSAVAADSTAGVEALASAVAEEVAEGVAVLAFAVAAEAVAGAGISGFAAVAEADVPGCVVDAATTGGNGSDAAMVTDGAMGVAVPIAFAASALLGAARVARDVDARLVRAPSIL